MGINISSYAVPAPELPVSMTASFVSAGSFVEAPVIIIFDNQSTTSTAAVSFDGGATTWKTFTAGEALVLDMRANHGIASNFTFVKGTTIHVKGNGAAAGTFSISYVYAKNQ